MDAVAAARFVAAETEFAVRAVDDGWRQWLVHRETTAVDGLSIMAQPGPLPVPDGLTRPLPGGLTLWPPGGARGEDDGRVLAATMCAAETRLGGRPMIHPSRTMGALPWLARRTH